MRIRFGLALIPLFLLVFASAVAQQQPAGSAAAPPATAVAPTTDPAALGLARAALKAQGGDKFRDLKTLFLNGTVDVFFPNSTAAAPGTFYSISAGDRSSKELRSATSFVRQIYDGKRGYFSLRGLPVLPPAKYGLGVLAKFDQPGYVVTALPEKDKLQGFRITGLENNSTDFYVDPKTHRVMRHTVQYKVFTLGTEYKSFKTVEGVLVPESFTEGLQTPQGNFYVEYKVKEIKLNQPVGDDVFVIPAS